MTDNEERRLTHWVLGIVFALAFVIYVIAGWVYLANHPEVPTDFCSLVGIFGCGGILAAYGVALVVGGIIVSVLKEMDK